VIAEPGRLSLTGFAPKLRASRNRRDR
jgi:hypothetical protein